MARSLTPESPKPFDMVKGNRKLAESFVFGIDSLDTCQVQHGIEQHRSMPVGQDEAVPIRPNRVVRVEPQKPLPECVNLWRQRHCGAGVSGVGLLDGINRERSDGIDAK